MKLWSTLHLKLCTTKDTLKNVLVHEVAKILVKIGLQNYKEENNNIVHINNT